MSIAKDDMDLKKMIHITYQMLSAKEIWTSKTPFETLLWHHNPYYKYAFLCFAFPEACLFRKIPMKLLSYCHKINIISSLKTSSLAKVPILLSSPLGGFSYAFACTCRLSRQLYNSSSKVATITNALQRHLGTLFCEGTLWFEEQVHWMRHH